MYVDKNDLKLVLDVLELDLEKGINSFNYAYLFGKISVLKTLGLISSEKYEMVDSMLRDYEKER